MGAAWPCAAPARCTSTGRRALLLDLAGRGGGRKVVTIEAWPDWRAATFTRCSRQWIEQDVVQCGYCQSGQIMSAAALLASKPHPTDEEIDAVMTGNLLPLRHLPAHPGPASTARPSSRPQGNPQGNTTPCSPKHFAGIRPAGRGLSPDGRARRRGRRTLPPRLSQVRRRRGRPGHRLPVLRSGGARPPRSRAPRCRGALCAECVPAHRAGWQSSPLSSIIPKWAGSLHGAPMLVAEELDADWSLVRTEFAPV